MLTTREEKINLLFIGNFFTSPKVAMPLLSLLKKDIDLVEKFTVSEFEFNSNMTLKELGKKLWDKVNQDYTQKPVYLVCHGLGTFIAFKFLFLALNDNQGNSCRNIKRIILFAPPIPENKNKANPYKKLTWIRFFLLQFLNPTYKLLKQIIEMREDILKLKNFIYDHVVDTKSHTDTTVMIPMFAIYGSKDPLINPILLKSFIGENHIEVNGDHISIMHPKNGEDNIWIAFKAALMEPLGHKHIVEVKRFQMKVAIEPTSLGVKEVGKDRYKEKMLEEHIGQMTYEVSFSKSNISKNRFPIKFSVSTNGYIEQLHSNFKNEAEPQNLGRFTRFGNDFEAQLNPKELGENAYKLILKATNGFNDAQYWGKTQIEALKSNHRETDFFLPLLLGQGGNHYHTIEIVLDLTGFTSHDYLIKDIQVYWIPTEISVIQKYQVLHERIGYHTQMTYPYDSTESGLYTIRFQEVNSGTILVFWKIANSN